MVQLRVTAHKSCAEARNRPRKGLCNTAPTARHRAKPMMQSRGFINEISQNTAKKAQGRAPCRAGMCVGGGARCQGEGTQTSWRLPAPELRTTPASLCDKCSASCRRPQTASCNPGLKWTLRALSQRCSKRFRYSIASPATEAARMAPQAPRHPAPARSGTGPCLRSSTCRCVAVGWAQQDPAGRVTMST